MGGGEWRLVVERLREDQVKRKEQSVINRVWSAGCVEL